MNLDAFTVFAQIVNFVILVLLLRHFLYKRIVRVMDQREKNIAERIEEAEKKKEEAEKDAESYQNKRKELEDKKKDLISRAEKEAEDRKKELVQKAREDVDRTQKRWRESLQQQKETFLHDLRRRTGEQIFHMARKTLKDLADVELEKYIVEAFLKRLQDLGKKEKSQIKESLQGAHQPALVFSRFQMPEKLQQKIEKTIREGGGKDVQVKFKTSEDLIGGIELEIGDSKLSWGIDIYLGDLEEEMSEAFEQRISEEKTEGKEKGEKPSEKGGKQERENEKGSKKQKRRNQKKGKEKDRHKKKRE